MHKTNTEALSMVNLNINATKYSVNRPTTNAQIPNKQKIIKILLTQLTPIQMQPAKFAPGYFLKLSSLTLTNQHKTSSIKQR